MLVGALEIRFHHAAQHLCARAGRHAETACVRGARFRMTPRPGAQVLCGVVEPYFERTYEHFSGHSYTPPRGLSQYAAIIASGRAITWAVPVLQAFGQHASVPYRELLGGCLDRLLPEPLLRAGGPAHLETAVVSRNGTMAVHLLSFPPSRQAEDLDLVHDPFPLVDVPVSLRMERPPHSAALQPSGQELEFPLRRWLRHDPGDGRRRPRDGGFLVTGGAACRPPRRSILTPIDMTTSGIQQLSDS